jgi:predicted helicase
MRKTVEFDEFTGNGLKFEDLVADYFKEIKDDKNISNIKDIEVRQSGEGPDGGCDILLTFEFTDLIKSFQRKWIVQCKFLKESVGKKHLSSVNIPTLIHEYGADGYLLVCRRDVTSNVRQMFENLQRNCRFSYDYEIWKGNDLKKRIQDRGNSLVSRYFPEHFEYLQKLEKGFELEDL